MKRSEMITILAEQIFFRDLARDHQFWYDDEDKPNFNNLDFKDKVYYLRNAHEYVAFLEKFGMNPPQITNGKNIGKYEWEDEDGSAS